MDTYFSKPRFACFEKMVIHDVGCENMRFHLYKMTSQGVFAVTHLFLTAATFSMAWYLRIQPYSLRVFCRHVHSILTLPLGFYPGNAIPCRGGEFSVGSVAIAGVLFAINSYFWALIVFSMWRLIKNRKKSANKALESSV
jgi:hypothetical protein